jgi:23S rRNA G2445 N2-methylase RlmL
MKESLAAGLLLAAGWKDQVASFRSKVNEEGEACEKRLTLVDPMCGSGSLVLEAAMMAVDFAPGLMRVLNDVPGSKLPPVLRWRDNRDDLLPLWKDLLKESSESLKAGLSWMKENEGRIEILGNDIHPGALELVESSLKQAGGLDRIVRLHHNDCSVWNLLNGKEREHNQVFVTTNPPWGVRLSDNDHESWESLRTFLREKCPSGRTEAWVLSGNKSATKHLGLRRSQSVSLQTGQQDLRWIQYIMLDRSSAEADDDQSRRQQLKTTMLPAQIKPERVIRTRSIPKRAAEPTRSFSAPPRSRRQPPSQQRSRKASSTRAPDRGDDDSWI